MSLQRVASFFAAASVLGIAAWGQTARCAAWTVENGLPNTDFGVSVSSAGDVNGDGYGDVLVGAPAMTNGQEAHAYLYLGSPTGLATTPAWTLDGGPATLLGSAVASAGDVNGDGFDDVLIGAPWFENGQSLEGAAFVYLGSASGLATSAAWSAEGDAEVAVLGGSVASAGDVNGDGFGDVILGAYGFSDDQVREGRVFVYLGSAAGLAQTPAWTVDGDQQDSFFGDSVASAGDVNGDGFGDVIIGAPYISDPEVFEGRATVYLGSATGLAAHHAWKAEGGQLGFSLRLGAHLGESVATAGDVNGDGFSDVIVGAPSFTDGTLRQDGEGGAFVYLGSASGLGASPAWHVEGNQDNTYLGDCVASAGDVNGDGFGDVIVGAWEYTPRGGPTLAGRALAYLGSASGLATEPNWKADGDQAREAFGSSVSAAGDVNGDGYGDVIVGASFVYFGDPSAVGHADAYMGSRLGLGRAFAFPGDHVNADTIEPVDVILGSAWNAPLHIGHPHGSHGVLSLSVRTTAINGPSFVSPVGGRTTEILISGPLLATIQGSYLAFSGDIPPQPIPSQPSLLGLAWAAQYSVIGGGFVDLSQAVYGVVDSCP